MNEINMIDKFEQYSLDKISCFERPICNVLEYYYDNSGSLCIMMMKIFQMYRIKDTNPRESLLNYIKESFGCNVFFRGSLSVNKIKRYIDKEIPVIVGIDLEKMFYSSYYKKNSWPHWITITGYDDARKRFTVFDNTQFSEINSKYAKFYITYSVYKKANKSYVAQYGRDYASVVFEKGDNDIDYGLEIKKILSFYRSIDKQNSEISMHEYLVKEFQKNQIRENMYSKMICEEIKKKIINISKYHYVFFEEIANAMKNLGYDKKNINELKNMNTLVAKEMNNNDLKIIVNLSRKCPIGNRLMNDDENVKHMRKLIDGFYNFISSGDVNQVADKIKQNPVLPDRVENNKDGIISYYNGEYSFDFKNGQYNWWIEDEAPKVILFHGRLSKQHLLFKTKIFITEDSLLTNLQAGIFIRDVESEDLWLRNGYFGAVDCHGKLVFDAIGNDNNEKEYNIKEENKLFLEITDGNIWFGIYKDNGDLERLFSKPFEQLGLIELGFACKTWNNGNRLHILYSSWKID